jgi:hypothetical protein
MQNTVDQAPAPVPRGLTDIIEDARRAVCGHCWADSLARPCSSGSCELHLARFARPGAVA